MTATLAPVRRWAGLADLERDLRELLARKGADINDVDDVIQETYLRAARYRHRVDDPRTLRAWTKRIALNVLADLRRRARRVVELSALEDFEDDPVHPDLVVSEEEARLVRVGRWILPEEDALVVLERTILLLRADDRALLSSYYLEKRSLQDCAGTQAVSTKLVKVRLYRARRRLVAAMDRLLSLSRDGFALEPIA